MIQVSRSRIVDLKVDAKSFRIHPPAQIAALKASLLEFGWTIPLLIDKASALIAGRARLLAATEIRNEGGLIPNWPWPAEVPTIAVEHLTEAQRRAYVLADNKIAGMAGWDEKLLKAELADLKSLGRDLVLIGFTAGELDRLLGPAPGSSCEDTLPEIAPVTVTRPGDLWLLGPHRLLCADATSARSVYRLFDGRQPGLMATDPPYGVRYDPTWRDQMSPSGKVPSRGKVSNDHRADWRAAFMLFHGDVAYVWHGGLHATVVADGLRSLGFELRSQILWRKQHFAIGRGDYHWQHECAWYAVRSKSKRPWFGGRKQSTVWDVANASAFGGCLDDGKTIHSTQKPVELMRRSILNHTEAGGLVYDPFSGSGSTLIAAESSGRTCLGLEIDPVYVDVIVRRWQAFAGGIATLDGPPETGGGRPFDTIAAERTPSPPA